MLRCHNTSANLTGNCSDMTVLERQRTRMKWQQEQQELLHHQSQSFYGGNESSNNSVFSSMAEMGDSALGEVVAKSIKPDPGSETRWPDLGQLHMPSLGFGSPGFDVNSAISRTSMTALEDSRGRDSVSAKEKMSTACGNDSFKKRKSDKFHSSKVVAESGSKEKKMKGVGEEWESKVTDQNSGKNITNNNRETCGGTPKENSKASEVQKPDYIHVRARRGQATDSHSLAERVRREKISERMKYLQDLVPGCNKITGKAGMLDEIINYVQSLQRQVEFLSMKLAAVNPRLDFNLDDLFSKEVFGGCGPSFSTMGMAVSDMNNPATYLQFNSAQQMVSSCCALDIMGITNPTEIGLRRSLSAPVSIPETFLDSSTFTQILPSSTWESDFQNLPTVSFDQARAATSFHSQTFAGVVEASNPKMEM